MIFAFMAVIANERAKAIYRCICICGGSPLLLRACTDSFVGALQKMSRGGASRFSICLTAFCGTPYNIMLSVLIPLWIQASFGRADILCYNCYESGIISKCASPLCDLK